MMAYISRLSLFRKALEEDYDVIISERSIFTDKNVFAQMKSFQVGINPGDTNSSGNKMAQMLTIGFKQKLDSRAEALTDAEINFNKEMPLSIRIETFQRHKLLEGLKPQKDAAKRENVKCLQSLQFIQKFEDEIDETTEVLRARNYSEFRKDPTGEQYMDE